MRPLLLLPLIASIGAAQAADGARVGIGVETSSGRYGTASKTRVDSIPLSASATRGRWTVRASVPWLRVEGDSNVVPGLGTVPNGNPQGRGRTGLPIVDPALGGAQPGAQPAPPQRGTASGVGDARLGATYLVAGKSAGIGFTGNAKIATADEDKGLGTGANDYGAAVDVYRNVGTATLYGGVGYTRFGRSRYIDVDAATNANAGASVAAGRGRVGMQVDWREAVTRTTGARREATGFYSRPVGKKSDVQVFASKGMGDGSPDWGAGVGVNIGF
ncbi:transporter [Lysobacter humi (ex Lee et al. 2017)]